MRMCFKERTCILTCLFVFFFVNCVPVELRFSGELEKLSFKVALVFKINNGGNTWFFLFNIKTVDAPWRNLSHLFFANGNEV